MFQTEIQLEKLKRLLGEIWEHNPFYTHKWRNAGLDISQIRSLGDLQKLPLTTRAELVADQSASPPLGTNLSCPLHTLRHVHRSSGTTLATLYWADTTDSWSSVLQCSEALFRMADVSKSDRLFFALPFGLSSGPWIMYEGARRVGCDCFFPGAPQPADELVCLKIVQPAVLIGKPSHLRSLAGSLEIEGRNPQSLGVAKLILTGERTPVSLRLELEQLWKAECFDRYGLTEAGSVAGECIHHPGGMHLLETDLIAEVIDPHTTQPVKDGEQGELVLTNLGRLARPIVRYRTGDQVRLIRNHDCACGRTDALLLGGIHRQTSPGNKCALQRTRSLGSHSG